MADDITLSVHVRDMTRGQFQRLDRDLDRLRRDVRQLGRDGNGAGERMRRLDQSLGAVQGRMRRLHQTGQMTSREMGHMRSSLAQVSREALNAARSGEITRDQYHRFRAEIDRTRLSFDRLGNDIRLHGTRMRGAGNDAERLRQAAQRLRIAEDRLRLAQLRSQQQSVRLTQSQGRLDVMRRRQADQTIVNANRIRQADDRLRLSAERLRLAQARFAQSQNNSSRSMRRFGNEGTFVGKMFGNMRAKLIGTAVVLIASLMPTIGALAPMLAGIGAVAGVAALAFMGLNKPASMLSKTQKEFLKSLKPITGEFKKLQQSAQKAVLPSLGKSFKDVAKMVEELNPVIDIAGKSLGDLVGKIARGISSKEFMGPFLKNVKMGTEWLDDFLGSFGKFTIAFFDFGTKSKPALDAWQDLLGGFMDRGLPGMFKNMESGVKGASIYLHGLSSLINDGLLPGLGTLLGKFMEAFGPTLGKLLRGAAQAFDDLATDFGDAFVALGPAVKVVGNLVDSLMDLTRISFGSFFDTIKEVGGALLKTFVDVFAGGDSSKMTTPLNNLSSWVRENEPKIRGAFTEIGSAFISMISQIIQGTPTLLEGLSYMVKASLGVLDIFVSGLAAALGDIPGIGDKFKEANKKFDEFSASVTGNLDKAVTKSREFADQAVPNLQRAQLKLKVDEFQRNLDDAKTALKDPALTQERKAKLTADKEEAEKNLSAAKRDLAAFDRKKARATIDATAAPFFSKVDAARAAKIPKKNGIIDAATGLFNSKLAAVRGARIPKKTGAIDANTGGFWGKVKSLVGRVLGTSYINVSHRMVDTMAAPKFKANGGVMKFFADGGENHVAQIAPAGSWRVWGEPETGGESYIPLAPSKRPRSRAIAEDTVGILGGQVEWFAKGKLTKSQKAAKKQAESEKQARNDARGDLTLSHFGKMAGYKNDEFKHALGLPEALGGLVDSLNHWRSVIMKSTHGAVEKSLLKQLDKAGKSLIKYEKNLTKVNKSLEKAQTKLSDLKSAAASMRESVSSGVMSATDITKAAAGGDKNVTMGDIMNTMRNNTDKASAFSSALAQLKKRGVSADVIAQIAQAGIDGGGLETATAMLDASDSQIAQINEMEKKIKKAAKDSGKTAADAMYAAGIKAAEGMVEGLKKKKKAIEKAMMDIAKAMEKAIKHALGIKSPSRVMMKVGHMTAEGFAVGIKKNSSPSAAWQSMLNTTATTPGSASSGGGTYVIPVYLGGKQFEEIVLDTNRKIVRTRGGDVQKVFGGR